MKLTEDFANISDIDYCIMRNLSNLEVINSFKSVYNLSPKIGMMIYSKNIKQYFRFSFLL